MVEGLCKPPSRGSDFRTGIGARICLSPRFLGFTLTAQQDLFILPLYTCYGIPSPIMSSLSPEDIRDLRHRLGWTGEQMGSFFDRTKDTIYRWENGDSSPGKTAEALIDVLRTELTRRTHQHSHKDVSAWIEKLEKKGVFGFLESLIQRPEREKDTHHRLARKAEKHSGLLLKRNRSEPLAYVMPLTESGFADYTRGLLQISELNENLPGTPS